MAGTAMTFFFLEAHGTQRAVGHVAASESSSTGRGSGAIGHVAAPKPSIAGRRGLGP
jgi:hypothetical protein